MPGKKLFGLLLTFTMLLSCVPSTVYAKDYSKYSNTIVEFGLNLRTDHKRPECARPKGVKKLSTYNTYYYNSTAYKANDKVIYLTFDCGYENGNTGKILDTLKKEKIKAIFFVTEPYVKENTKLVKRMKKEGHLVGNHTCTHPRLTSLSVDKMKKEVTQCKKTMEKKTGYTMDPYMRPPEGVYSVRVMKVMQDLGFNTMLWSLALYDYEENDQPAVSTVVDKFNKHHFCGMMPLLHVISSADRKALPQIISSMKKKGYRFGTVDEFAVIGSEDKETKKTDKKAVAKKADKKSQKKSSDKDVKKAGKKTSTKNVKKSNQKTSANDVKGSEQKTVPKGTKKADKKIATSKSTSRNDQKASSKAAKKTVKKKAAKTSKKKN